MRQIKVWLGFLILLLTMTAYATTELPKGSAIAHYMINYGVWSRIPGARDYSLYCDKTDSLGNPIWPGITVPSDAPSPGDYVDDQLAMNYGVQGFAPDLFYGKGYEVHFYRMLKAAHYLQSKGNYPLFTISPSLDFSGTDTSTVTSATIVTWVNTLQTNADSTCWASWKGKPIVWVYNGCSLGLLVWQNVARALPNVQFILDDLTIVLNGTGTNALVDSWTSTGVGLFPFRGDIIPPRAVNIALRSQATGALCVGDLIPRYWRQVLTPAGLVQNNVSSSDDVNSLMDNLTTAWKPVGCDLYALTTWNDNQEASGFRPDIISRFSMANYLKKKLFDLRGY
jgi:hypothetical protein